MIAVDTSALVAYAAREPEAEAVEALLLDRRAIIGAPTAFEFVLVMARRHVSTAAVTTFLRRCGVEVVSFGELEFEAAVDALDRFGRGRHPARLNFGDCLSYALARTHDVPLLYVGDDFTRTDIAPALG